MAKRLIIYHGGGCRDGFCAAWLLSHAFPGPETEFVAAQYNEPAPDCAGKQVIIADFSYPRAAMQGIISVAESVVVLDHHKTAKTELEGLAAPNYQCVFDMTRSGAQLTWNWLCSNGDSAVSGSPFFEFFKNMRAAPWLVQFTADRDLWKWVLPSSREINANLRSFPLDFAVWDTLHRIADNELFSSFFEGGKAILRADQQLIDQHVRQAYEVELFGHRVLCVNTTVSISEIAGELARGRPFGMTYFDRQDGKRVWSLRSDGGPVAVDVSKVANKVGGGGHKQAAGFETGQQWVPMRPSDGGGRTSRKAVTAELALDSGGG